ncbi:MAG TPA: WecB/TagA/CpsF family glycosyltransferase [Acidobacteriaceae bacterium]|nr:WecB/TagA/CpsF family glycosyltransferase [Acidobacteriaceae bacterium]
MPPRTSLGNLDIDTFTEPALIDEVLHHALTGATTRHIATINAQFYVLAENSRPFRECLRKSEYHCADGMSIVWACNAFGSEPVARIAGVDLISHLCEGGAATGMRVYLLGGRPGTAAKTALILEAAYPGIVIAGVSCPDWGFEKDELMLKSVLDDIAEAKPNILFVAFGAPKQEFFIDTYIRPLEIPIAVGIGGSFEILSGETTRAPQWMQSAGLEWSFRLMQDPGRLWRRYMLGNIEFLWCVAKWRYRKTNATPVTAR